MPKIELSLKGGEKEELRRAAESENLALATWARAKLLGLARAARKESGE